MHCTEPHHLYNCSPRSLSTSAFYMPFIVRLTKWLNGHLIPLGAIVILSPESQFMADTPRVSLAHRHFKGYVSFSFGRPELRWKHQYNFNLKPKRATVHSYVCMPIHTSAHIYKHEGHMHFPDVRVRNLHPCLHADVWHQHITRRAALWWGLEVIHDQTPSLVLWTTQYFSNWVHDILHY